MKYVKLLCEGGRKGLCAGERESNHEDLLNTMLRQKLEVRIRIHFCYVIRNF